MKKTVCAVIALLLILSPAAAAESVTETDAITTEEITEAAPEEETDPSLDVARTFLNINFALFGCAVALFVVCTVVFIVYKVRKGGKNGDNS